MRKWINTVLMAVVIGLVQASGAWSADSTKDTAELKKLYKSYKVAVADSDYQLASVLAYDTWKASESSLGAAKQTGDFAYNYAVIAKAIGDGKRNKRIEEAFKRSLELSQLHGDKTALITLRRNVDFLGYWLELDKLKSADAVIKTAEDLVQTSGLQETEAYALLQNGKSELAYRRKKYADADSAAQLAVDIYEKLELSNTKEAYLALYNLSAAQTKVGKWLPAMLGFEKIYTNIDNVLPPKSQLIGRAFLLSNTPEREYKKENNLEYSDLSSILKCQGCWPKFDAKYLPNLEKRNRLSFQSTAPKMPGHAMSSGFVVLMFDTNVKGMPENIRIIQASHAKTFDRASVNVAKTWKVTNPETNEPASGEKDLVTQITFKLTGRSGKVLDFYGVPIK